jgi:hypothetical protein
MFTPAQKPRGFARMIFMMLLGVNSEQTAAPLFTVH